MYFNLKDFYKTVEKEDFVEHKEEKLFDLSEYNDPQPVKISKIKKKKKGGAESIFIDPDDIFENPVERPKSLKDLKAKIHDGNF